jgi:hypothetical protein
MKDVLGRISISLFIALAIPLVHLWIVCRMHPASEKCVWGKAYLPLTLVAYGVLATPVVYFVLWVIGNVRRR